MSFKSDLRNQKNAGKYKGHAHGKSVWHLHLHKDRYWCGNWGERTPRQLLKECQTIIKDLYKNHPELKDN